MIKRMMLKNKESSSSMSRTGDGHNAKSVFEAGFKLRYLLNQKINPNLSNDPNSSSLCTFWRKSLKKFEKVCFSSISFGSSISIREKLREVLTLAAAGPTSASAVTQCSLDEQR